MADSRLVDTANQLMTVLVSELESEGINVPDRRYIHTGSIAHDFVGENCADAFVISWQRNFQGSVSLGTEAFSGAAIKCIMPMSAEFQIALIRCVPVLDGITGAPPSAAELTAKGAEIMTDAMTLGKVIVENATTEDLVGLQQVAIASVNSIGPQGGVGGTVVTLFVSLL